ncbi:MAG: hydroxymyristoyl-ACP dehydratase [Paludibacteraceae bacterium]|nr:hydroxymyristoyl-ACP dehydratase [Paludibacteraceae bacterium]
MLKDKFFSIKEQTTEDETSKFVVKLNKEHKIYEGHFPNMPVVPGVCTLQMIKECVEGVVGKKLRYTNIANCKFSAMIVPTQVEEVEISATMQTDENGLTVKATVKSTEASYLTLKAILTEIA